MATVFRKIYIVLLFVLLSIMSGNSFGGPAGGIITGGYSEADVNSDNVKEVAEFAVHQQYPNGGISYKVIEGTQIIFLKIRIMKHRLMNSLHINLFLIIFQTFYPLIHRLICLCFYYLFLSNSLSYFKTDSAHIFFKTFFISPSNS